jgi:hypothetical protein
LPDDKPRALDRLAASIEDAPLHHDDFALGPAGHSTDNGQVISRDWCLNGWEVGPKNLMRRMLRLGG